MAKLPIAGFGNPGYIRDIGAYVSVPEAFDEVRNFRFNSRGAVSFGGYVSALSPASFSPRWLKMFPPLANPSWVYASNTQVGMFNTGHHDITRLDGQYNGINSERWQGEVFSGVGIFNNTQDVPQAWLEFNETKLINLPNWPAGLRCKSLRPFKQFLIAMNLTNSGVRQPFRVRWSHPADPGSVPASWVINDPAIDAGEFDIAETSDEIIDGLQLGDSFVVYKQKTTHIMQYIGGNDIFGRREIIPNRGLLWRDCVQPIPEGHFVVGADDIYAHTGQRGSEVSLVDDKLREWVFNQISADTYFNCFTVEWAKKNEIWFCFPEAGAEYPTIALVYNKITKGIGVKDIPNVPFMYPGPVTRGADQNPSWGGGPIMIGGRLRAGSATLPGSEVQVGEPPEPLFTLNGAIGDFGVSADLTWTEVEEATSYEIYGKAGLDICAAPVCSPVVVGDLDLLDTVSAPATGATGVGATGIGASTTWYFAVRAMNGVTPLGFADTGEGLGGVLSVGTPS